MAFDSMSAAEPGAKTTAPGRLGDYVLEAQLGRGGMAAVFRARLERGAFAKHVCIKRMHAHLTAHEAFRTMFHDEAMAQARVDHVNVVRAIDYVGGAEPYLVLELVEGITLKRLLAHHPRLPVALAVHIALCISRGLEAAHMATSIDGEPLALVHRDVSPDNVLLGVCGTVKLADFGVSRVAHALAEHTSAGAWKGKPGYMAPEQLLGSPVDHRADQFALGTVLWEMLAGKRLFGSSQDLATLQRVVEADVPLLADSGRVVPATLELAVRRALARERCDRYADMAALERALFAELDALAPSPRELDLREWVTAIAHAPARTAPRGDERAAAETGDAETIPSADFIRGALSGEQTLLLGAVETYG